jgi:hypothetical protein
MGRRRGPTGGPVNVFLTRLHVRYDRAHFPEDLVFQDTGDRENFQGRYVMQHPYRGEMSCSEAEPYLKGVWQRQKQEAKTLAELTGWSVADVEKKMELPTQAPTPQKKPWYKKLWSE